MNLHERIINSIRASASEVFSTMLGMEIGQGTACTENTPPEANDGVLSFIGVAGAWAGTGSVSCSANLACKLCSQMLMTEAPSVNEEVLDAVAELTNMIVGNVKTELEQELGGLGLSIPTVIFGRNFKAKTAIQVQWHVVRFEMDGEELQVRLCLAPRDKNHGQALYQSVQEPCALDV